MSTYACDCIEYQRRQRVRGLKTIRRHSEDELDAAVEAARRRFGDDFWLMLHGIDAYIERRRRRRAAYRAPPVVRWSEEHQAWEGLS